MHDRLFLVAVLVYFSCQGETLEVGVTVEILTSVGQTVTLPCRISTSNHQIPSVEWSKEGLKPNPIVFLYRSGCETFEEKNPAFRYRTNLFLNELKNGNVSLWLSNAQLSDTGTYICKQNQNQGPPREVLRVKLSVGAVSEPRLSLVVPAAADAADYGVTLQCQAICWFPKPEITFHDEQGNTIRSSESMKNDQDPSGCFNISKRVAVKNSTRVTCRVHQPEINETRVAEIYIPEDCMKSCTVIIIVAAIAIVIAFASCVLNGYLYKKYSNSVVEHRSLQAQFSNDSKNVEVHNPTNQADGTRQTSAEHLRETAELKSDLSKKEGIIHRLTEELTELRSKQSLVVCGHLEPPVSSSPSTSSPDVSKPTSPPKAKIPHLNNPKPAASTNGSPPKPGTFPLTKASKLSFPLHIPASGSQIQKGGLNHSSPALFPGCNPGASSAFPSEKTPATRSMSMSESRPRPNPGKLQRRYTTSVPSSNRFNVLADLNEDQEPLL